MNKTFRRISYAVCDFLAAEAVWVAFYVFRKKFLEPQKFGTEIPLEFDSNFYLGFVLIPLVWLAIYAMAGFYNDVFRRSRIRELMQSFLYTLIGSVLLFFLLMLDDEVADYTYYYKSFGFYFGLQFLCAYIPRALLTTQTSRAIQKGRIGFNTLIVGNGPKALDLVDDLGREKVKNGNRIVGFCTLNGDKNGLLNDRLAYLGPSDAVSQTIRKHGIEEVIIATESDDDKLVQKVIDRLSEHEVLIKAIPDLHDILSGSIRMTAIFGTPLIVISPVVMPPWQQTVKRGIDLAVSLFALTLLAPFFAVIALLIKRSDKGPVFYRQERIGLRGQPFYIIKFRTMYENAETQGPALSSKNDPRITPVGRFLRKYRFDEFPQFINVLKGDMSLVGPRPERQFFIEQIVEKAPHYRLLHKIRPGITSWGMVKYGYAENVDEMVRRMRYDILYIENMSLILDLKILIYTVLTVVGGRGQ